MIEFLKPFYVRLLGPFAAITKSLKIHPNAVTASGLVFSVIAAWFIARGSWFLGAVFIGIGACTDGLDGLVANLTGKKTRFGAIFDSTSDRFTEMAWFLGLLAFYCNRPVADRWGIYFAFLAMAGSMMVSYVRARCEGVNVPCKGGFLQRPERIIILIVCLFAGRAVMKWGLLALLCAALATVIERLVIAYRVCRKNGEGAAEMRQ
jgi:CDP-diacylglycerol---glycerol-3-phosphate 3-phosphatidyltransferase